MPCAHDHTHIWPRSGPLVIDRCEIYCQYCRDAGDKALPHKFAWFLRRHVKGVQIKNGKGTHPNIVLVAGWTGKEDGSKTLVGKKQLNTNRHTRIKKSLPASLSPSLPPVAHAINRDASGPSFVIGGDLEAFVDGHSSGEEMPYDDYTDLAHTGTRNDQQPAGRFSEDEHCPDDRLVIVTHATDEEQQPDLNKAFAAVSRTYGNVDPLSDLEDTTVGTCALSVPETNIHMPTSSLTNPIDLTAMPDGPTTSSHRRSSTGTSLSSTNTPQRRIGPELTMEIPTMPNCLAHRNYLRAKLNEVIEFMESKNAKNSVVAWTLAEYIMHFNSGCAY
ncbi:hypothetical protein LTR56_023704 [Elasticomyces elasticus]|nr:hypothetical protein LTR22_025842 [Elasticomyces elasticus]KAK3619953.1 hypothetical protein LTR56_023704 [Elasticomyces elasticus]KAK5740198.1 hypothetical protein LTS12_025011 [Elasticomyces elasticus]